MHVNRCFSATLGHPLIPRVVVAFIVIGIVAFVGVGCLDLPNEPLNVGLYPLLPFSLQPKIQGSRSIGQNRNWREFNYAFRVVLAIAAEQTWKPAVRAEHVREGKWTESISVGSRKFVESIKIELRMKAKGRRICGTDDESSLRGPQASYSDVFKAQNGLLSTKSAYFWKISL